MQSCQHSRCVCHGLHAEPHIAQHETVCGRALVSHVCAVQVSKQVELSVLQVDAKVLLGDRRLHITLARVWAALTAWEKTRLVWMFVHSGLTISQIKQELEDDIESLKVRLTAVGCLHRSGFRAQSHMWQLLFPCIGCCIQLYVISLEPLLQALWSTCCLRLKFISQGLRYQRIPPSQVSEILIFTETC